MMAMPPKNNPFRSECVDALEYRLRDATWPMLLTRLEELRFRAAIVGPRGRGKTTLLDALAPRLRAQGWSTHRLRLCSSHRDFTPREWRTLSACGDTDLILLDGAEQLGPLRRLKLLLLARHAGGLVITTHRTAFFPTLYECRTSPELLETLVGKLAPQYALDGAASGVLHRRHRGNVRDALRELYDLVAL
jgi:hypothetical protein